MNLKNDDADTYVLKLLSDIDEHRGLWHKNIESLKRVDNSFIVKHTKKYLESSNAEDRQTGINVLMRTYPDLNYSLVIPFLSDADPDVRFKSVWYLSRVKKFADDAVLIDLIIHTLRNDASPDIRAEAAEVLGYVTVNIQNVINALLWARDNDKDVSSLGHPISKNAKDSLKMLSRSDK